MAITLKVNVRGKPSNLNDYDDDDKKRRGGGKELSLANSKTLKFFNVRFPAFSHLYVYFDIALDLIPL